MKKYVLNFIQNNFYYKYIYKLLKKEIYNLITIYIKFFFSKKDLFATCINKLYQLTKRDGTVMFRIDCGKLI
jgi:hypothetical protein